MAQNDVQKYADVQNLYASLRNVTGTFHNIMNQMGRLAIFLNSAEATDYASIPVGTLADMGQLRTLINAHAAATDTVDLITKIEEFIQI